MIPASYTPEVGHLVRVQRWEVPCSEIPGTAERKLLIETRREGRKMPGLACLPPLCQVAARILDGDGTDDAAQFWLAQRARYTT